MRTRDLAALAALTAAMGVAGCGSSGFAKESPADIVKASTEAVRGASSYILDGAGTQSGKPISIYLVYGGSKAVAMTVGTDSGRVAVILSDGRSYLKADAEFWKSQANAAAATKYANKWFKVASHDLGSLTGEVDEAEPDQLADCLTGDIQHATVSGSASIDGQSAVELKYTSASGAASTAYIAQASPHYPLQVTNQSNSSSDAAAGICDSGGSGGTVSFTSWNSAPAVKAPSDAGFLP